MSYHFAALAAASTLPPIEEGGAIVCPECSYLSSGSCVWCPDGADVPGCEGCVAHHRPAPPWFRRSEVLVPMAVAVATTVAATIVTTLTMRKLKMKGAS